MADIGLNEVVASGMASDEELAEFFGPDLIIRLAAQWRNDDHTKRLFSAWFADVMQPLDIAPLPAFTHDDLGTLATEGWYRTRPIADATDRGAHRTGDYRQLVDNLVES